MNADAPTAAADTGAKDEFRLLHTMLTSNQEQVNKKEGER